MENNAKIQKLEQITGKVILIEVDFEKKRFLCCGYDKEIHVLCFLGRKNEEIILYHVPIFQIKKEMNNKFIKLDSRIKYTSYNKDDKAYKYFNRILIMKKL
ncbi:MAG TPA: hypothetical protein ENG87_03500 [Candidatus Pacearchaeota archaeon]|nr:hypothetical protein BMS3Abin17_01205 [archaeon BMS3Abin17]HDK42419.1 hypothetical protein [Candidatus Pacearchaeota archaeon]HDZ60423.1 hypothetical protein [Candidatus Pacearchaeota archaeon]